MTGVALDGFHIAAIEFQLVGDAGVAERMEYNMRQSVFFDKFIESTVNHLAFHRTAIAGAKDQVIVDVFISKQIHQLINFFFSLYQQATVFGRYTRRILVLVLGSFRTRAVWVLAMQGGNFLITPLSLKSSNAPRVTRCSSLLTNI